MSKTKKKGGSVFAVFVVIILLIVVVVTVCVNIFFSGDRAREVGGIEFGSYYLYMNESADLEPSIPEYSLVVAKKDENSSLGKGAKVFCRPNEEGNPPAMRVIYNIIVNEDGSTSYFPGTAVEQGSELAIERGNIFAVCTWASKELYAIVTFATSVTGLMVLLVVPCIILIIMLLVQIAKSSREEIDEDDFDFDEDEIEMVTHRPGKRSAKSPLFDPVQANAQDESLEKKMASIQENFAEKPVNEDSPYQKAVQERTMKFKKIEQEDIERVRQEEAARAAEAAAVPEEPAPAVAEPEHTGYVPAHSSDVPVIRSDEGAQPEPVRSATPNIDDIIDPGELRAAKSGQRYNREIASTGSIDDLISALENEKKKL